MSPKDGSSSIAIGYLFIVHNCPELLARTIQRLDTGNACFFIHVDLKSDIKAFEDSLINIKGLVRFTKKRYSIQWMGYRMVAATLELMREARKFSTQEGCRLDYEVLLSGVDFPLRNGHEIETRLALSYPTNFLMYWNLGDLPDWLHKIEQYHYLDSKWHNQRAKPFVSSRFRLPFYRIEALRKKIHKVIPKRRMPLNMLPFGGSQWWMLTTEAVDYVLDLLESNPSVERFFRFTHSPDELFFQTVIMNSPLSGTVGGYRDYAAFIAAWKDGSDPEFVTDQARQSNLRYIDWDPKREFPSILDGRDFTRILSSGCLFGRKFDPQRSAELMDRLEQAAECSPFNSQ